MLQSHNVSLLLITLCHNGKFNKKKLIISKIDIFARYLIRYQEISDKILLSKRLHNEILKTFYVHFKLIF